jgi:hypothetical protein
MQSIKYLPASNQAANPSLMTVQTIRSAGATSIITNTVAGAPNFFFATMGTPHTFTDPVTGETITVISEASAVDFAGHLLSGHVEIDAIAPGYTDLGSKVGDIIIIRPITAWADNIFNILNAGALQDSGLLATTALDLFYKPSDITQSDFVRSGGVIAQTTLLTASFSDIVYYIGAQRYTKTGVANRVYTINKDTYVDIDAAGTLYYTEVANGATTGFTLVAGRVRLAKVVTNGTTITSVTQTGQDSNVNTGARIYPSKPIRSENLDVQTYTDANGWLVRWVGGKRIFTKKTTDNPNRAVGGAFIDATLGTGLPVGITDTSQVNVQMTASVSGNSGNWEVRLEAALVATGLSVMVNNTSADWKDIACYWLLTEI